MTSFVSALQPSEVRHSFELSPGVLVDCVPTDKQPAAAHLSAARRPLAALTGAPARTALRSLATPAPGAPGGRAGTARPAAAPHLAKTPAAMSLLVHDTHRGADAHGRDRRCPANTVPMRRTTMEDVSQFRSLADYNHKPRPPAPSVNAFGEANPHEHAALFQNAKSQGVHGFLSVFAPNVEPLSHAESYWGEFSLVQTWVLGYQGERGYESLQSVEAGLQVWPARYHDALPHLFVFSTQDGYAQTGCYEPCGKFVQTNPDIVIGAPLSHVHSAVDGPQYDVEFAWYRNAEGWWLMVNGATVGYYPASLFAADGLLSGANRFGFGGEVVNDLRAHPGRHTRTQMGSGHLPEEGYGRAAFVRDVFYYDTPSTAVTAALTPSRDAKATCYAAVDMESAPEPWGAYFFFGGPGYSDQCAGTR